MLFPISSVPNLVRRLIPGPILTEGERQTSSEGEHAERRSWETTLFSLLKDAWPIAQCA